MAKCHTCGKVVDAEATVCPGCGRPNPTKMRQGEVFGGAIGLIVVIIIIFASGGKDNDTKANQADQSNLPTVSTPLASASSDVPPSNGLQQADSQDTATVVSEPTQPVVNSVPVVQETSTVGVQSDDAESGLVGTSAATNPQFPYKAYVIDSRGKVVVQGGPSVFYKNVEELKSGDTVWAAGKDGKWISVQLLDGKIGYVRQRQLEFQ
ncbi:MAG: zinc ribbon domain-containing protein [Rhodanobacter lindaniclasticus]